MDFMEVNKYYCPDCGNMFTMEDYCYKPTQLGMSEEPMRCKACMTRPYRPLTDIQTTPSKYNG